MRQRQWAVVGAALFLAILLHPQAVRAQTAQADASASAQISVSAPSDFGLFWRDVRERLSLAFTFDLDAKAEKQLQFANERLRIAEQIAAENSGTKAAERAQKVIERASELAIKVAERRQELAQKQDERAVRILKNLASHEEEKDHTLDRIENRLSDDDRDEFESQRREMDAERDRILNALDNTNLPDAVKAHLEAVKARIEASAEVKSDFKDQMQELLNRIQSGDESAEEDLEQLREAAKDELERIRERFKEGLPVQAGMDTSTSATSSFRLRLDDERRELLKKQLESQQEELKTRLEQIRETAKDQLENEREAAKKRLELIRESQESEDEDSESSSTDDTSQ